MAACGIVLGAESHVLWDSFTHQAGWAVERVPSFSRTARRRQGSCLSGFAISVDGIRFVGHLVCIPSMDESGWISAVDVAETLLEILFMGGGALCLLRRSIRREPRAACTRKLPRSRHFAVVFITSFVRNVLIALCTVSIGAKVLAFFLSQKPPLTTRP